mmetsp:Transcript_78166/g.152929  ORF Transcript_78166/g.152929 Transcript_78166/m.152929 type:complete len:278 (-) Transcript_78166:3-836(-)
MASRKRGGTPSIASFFGAKARKGSDADKIKCKLAAKASAAKEVVTTESPHPESNPSAEALATALSDATGKVVKPVYMTNDCKSWYLLSRRYLPTPDKAAFEEQWDSHPSEYHQIRMFGKLVNESRWSQSWGVAYRYSSTVNTERPLHENAVVMDLIGAANNLVGCVHLGAPYNGCLQNWYEPFHKIGLHSDDEKSLLREVPIFSLSWGGPRRFLFRARLDSPSPCLRAIDEIMLLDGDLLVMGGDLQLSHKHEIPAVRKTLGPPTARRINWTIRAFR